MYVFLAVIAAGLGIVLYLVFAPGPRRWRAFHRSQKLLEGGGWQEALAVVHALPVDDLSPPWQARIRGLAGECHQRAVDQSLKERNFENAQEHAVEAAGLLGLDEDEQRGRIVESMLAEVRRLFAEGTTEQNTRAVLALIDRTVRLAGSRPPETLFWQALCEIRLGHYETALASLTTVFEQVGKQVLDPALYLGILLHRLGRPQDALRYLAEANRIDGGCPFITLQMGVSLIGAGGDSGMALRALQRALGSRGLGMWLNPSTQQAGPNDAAARAWVEAFPEAKSYVRRLAARYRYVCPLLGSDLSLIMRQGQLALAQAFYRQDRFAEAADVYGKLLADSPPTVLLLRGYGLSLARLGQHDQAYKHLRIALEQEDPKDPFTAGYLALCGALGKPTNSDDKPKNIQWALRLLARFPVLGNAEWAGLTASIHAEARKCSVPVSEEDQLLLCDSLASVQATDPRAALAYCHLAETFPDAVRPIYAWLYARAATVHGLTGGCDLVLFARTFQDPASARTFFQQHKWDLEEVEFTYLSRCAEQSPGRFPEAMGPTYPPQGETFLLLRSRQEEQAGRIERARNGVEVLLKLAPSSLAGHDRLACLTYRAGDTDRAVALLESWRRLAPTDHWPLVRQAILEQERGNAPGRAAAIDHALALTRGLLRAAVAVLGAKLALREAVHPSPGSANAAPSEAESARHSALGLAQHLLQECLQEQPDHVEAQWRLAAIRALQNDREGLAGQAAVMDRPAVTDARFHFFGAVCNLAAREYRRAIALGERVLAASPPEFLDPLEVESRMVMAWAYLHLGEAEAAQQFLHKVADGNTSPSAVYAQALLGKLCAERGVANEAIRWWSAVEPTARTRWGLDEPLRQMVLAAGLSALQEQCFEQAADRFREASKLGLRDQRLSGLIALALVKAGQRLLYLSESHKSASRNSEQTLTTAAQMLEQAVQAGNPDSNVLYLLALACKRQGKTKEARTALGKIKKPDANIVMQMGLLSLAENQIAQAEGEFARAWAMEPAFYETCYNLLLTQLTLGKVQPALELIPRAIELLEQRNGSGNGVVAPNVSEERRFLQMLNALLKVCQKNEQQGRAEAVLHDMHPADEQRLLRVVRSLGQLDTVHTLLRTLADARPRSMPVREAYAEAVLVKGKDLMDRCHWTEAELLLRPLARERGVGRKSQISLFNLLGCCSCVTQDFDGALTHFATALKLAPNDPRLQQNIALTYELQGDLAQADPHWNRYFDLLTDQLPVPLDVPNYLDLLAYESLNRLAVRYTEKEKWASAMSYMQRALQVRPNEPATLEQMFFLLKQAQRFPDARRTLEQLRRLRPDEPQYELFELDLIDLKGIADIEKVLTEIDRLRKRFPGDAQVEDRATTMVAGLIPLMRKKCEQLSEDMEKVIDQVRNLPNYQIKWDVVREVMRDLLKEFQKLRRLTGKCLPLMNGDENRRMVRDLGDLIDKKMELCKSMGA